MKFHLQFPIKPFFKRINYSDKLFFIGGCFADNIGKFLTHHKYKTIINPNGISYNPISIASSINRYIDNSLVSEDELFLYNDCWHSWQHHSCFSGQDKVQTLAIINHEISSANTFIKTAGYLFITFGSAYVYNHNASSQRVANCHKVPSTEFTKQLISVEEIVAVYTDLLNKMKLLNEGLVVVFTVSPVRYIRDGVVENNLSKSILIQTVHKIIEMHTNTCYFPAYELLMDDLRDYRFYKEDMVHPNETALNYVCDKFVKAAIDEKSQELVAVIKEIKDAIHHKPFNSNTAAYEKFKALNLKKCKTIQADFSDMDMSSEIAFFS